MIVDSKLSIGKTKNKIAIKKQIKIKTLKLRLWKPVSYYVRYSQADFRGYVKCYTCGKLILAKEANASHFIHNKLDFDLRNLKPCCTGCNLFKHGNLGIYARKLIEENGIDWVKQLEHDAILKGNDYSREELLILLEKFNLLVKNLK